MNKEKLIKALGKENYKDLKEGVKKLDKELAQILLKRIFVDGACDDEKLINRQSELQHLLYPEWYTKRKK